MYYRQQWQSIMPQTVNLLVRDDPFKPLPPKLQRCSLLEIVATIDDVMEQFQVTREQVKATTWSLPPAAWTRRAEDHLKRAVLSNPRRGEIMTIGGGDGRSSGNP